MNNEEKKNATNVTTTLTKGMPTRKITAKTNLPTTAENLPGANDPIEFLIEGMLEKNTFNSIIGPSKAGKSLFSLQMAFCVQNGLPFLGHDTHQCNVLYVDCELDSRHINRRVESVKEYYNFPDGQSPQYLIYNKGLTSGGVRLDTMISDIRNALDRDPEIGLVICDCFYYWCEGARNQEGNVKNYLTPLKELVSEYDICLNYVHHTSKGGIKKDPTANDIINAGGGSGVHGKIVDTALVIFPKSKGLSPTRFTVAGVGRAYTIDAVDCERSAETNGFFLSHDEEVQERLMDIPADAHEIADYITDNSIKDLRAVKDHFNISIEDLRALGFTVDSKNHRIAFNEADLVVGPKLVEKEESDLAADEDPCA